MWTLLKNRYDNKRFTIKRYVRAIHEIPQATKEPHSNLRRIVDVVQINIRALKVLNRPVDTWDDVLVDHISSKLNESLR